MLKTKINNLKNRGGILAIVCCLSGFQTSSALAEDGVPQDRSFMSQIEWLKFRAEAVGAIGSGSQQTYSTLVSWDPQFKLNEQWGAGLGLGYSLFRQTASSLFSVFEWTARGDYTLNPSSTFELQVGAQTWTARGGSTALLLGANYQFSLKEPLFGWEPLKIIDHFIVGYSHISQSSSFQIIRLGVAVRF